MLVICPDCDTRYEVPKSNHDLDISCACGKPLKILPWMNHREVIGDTETSVCPLCGQRYDLQNLRPGTEIACHCGNRLTVQEPDLDRNSSGRRKNDQTSRLRETELQGLIDTSRLIHSSIHDLNRLLMLIVRITADMLETEGATIVLREPKQGDLVFHSISGKESSKLQSFRIAEGEGIAGTCIQTRKSVVVNDTQKDARFSSRADKKSGFSTHSILCVPLDIDNTCIGALEAVNKKRASGFDEHDLLLAEAVASQIAVAIQNVQLTEEAIRTERLAAIGEAVTGIAHCIKNMLHGLKGGLFMVKTTLKKTTGQTDDRGYAVLERNQNRLTGLVQDMLTYSKDREPEYEAADLNELVGSVVELMQTKAGERQIKLDFKPDDTICEIVIDPKGVYRCVLNLVSNAIDACEDEGARVTVSTGHNNGKKVRIDVADEGCGMDAETLATVFQPFVSSKGSQGTGLGLSITRKIIAEHGGRISVESTEGQGSTFSIHLPTDRQT
ncbi:MAG: GAF domain-containing protein [Desulfobacterales bacterium]|nr:GAF domain-containing protein [Desulfobacterales bacterium]